MRVQSLLVESVDLRRLGGSAGRKDLPGDGFDGSQVASREKELGPLPRKGARDSAADPASGSVDHGNLILQHHLCLGPGARLRSADYGRGGGQALVALLVPTEDPQRAQRVPPAGPSIAVLQGELDR